MLAEPARRAAGAASRRTARCSEKGVRARRRPSSTSNRPYVFPPKEESAPAARRCKCSGSATAALCAGAHKPIGGVRRPSDRRALVPPERLPGLGKAARTPRAAGPREGYSESATCRGGKLAQGTCLFLASSYLQLALRSVRSRTKSRTFAGLGPLRAPPNISLRAMHVWSADAPRISQC